MAVASNPRALFKMSTEHAKLAPLDGKTLIVHVIVNIEYWPYDQPTSTPDRRSAAWTQPHSRPP